MSEQLLLLLAAGAALELLVGWLLLRLLRQQRRLQLRLALARGDRQHRLQRAAAPRLRLAQLPLRLIGLIGGLIANSGLLPARNLAELSQNLTLCGFPGRNGLSVFIGSKILLLVGGPALTVVLTGQLAMPLALARFLPFLAAAVGLLGPDYLLRGRLARTLARLESGVPDALDLLVICTRSGLSLGPAMERVASELGEAHPDVARELAQTTRELQIAVDSATALNALASRTGLVSLKRVATTMIQTTQFGTPISEALRVLSAEMRQEMLVRYEEKAARLPVMLTIPMITFILPCIFIVCGGPAALQIMKAFAHH